ncbi:hypothetical protein [Desulfofundulus thermocisternus]|uniref:hypothetical protein n=1 Tax=Desulfofundulus thermocisternus TaxID=42471 RepID=UPI00217DD62D|nr:hypothetical protein [Desulfofundulus thermocisternus]
MRLIARPPDKKQVGFLVDSLRNAGFDRKDMVITGLADAKEKRLDDPEEAADEPAFIKSENDGLWEAGPFVDGIDGCQPGGRAGHRGGGGDHPA